MKSYHLINGSISKLSDTVNLDNSIWTISDMEIKYKECIKITLNSPELVLNINKSSSEICQKLSDNGIQSRTYSIN